MPRLTLINEPNRSIETPLSLNCCAYFCGLPHQNPECGSAFDFVPDKPGVIVFLNDDGSASRIESAKSMKDRLTAIYKGAERVEGSITSVFAYDPTADAEKRANELARENITHFDRIPMRKAG